MSRGLVSPLVPARDLEFEHVDDEKLDGGLSALTDVLGADAAIARANAIDAEMEKLREERDSLLDPLATAAMLAGDVAVMELIAKLPSGFHRSELRTWLTASKATPNAALTGGEAVPVESTVMQQED